MMPTDGTGAQAEALPSSILLVEDHEQLRAALCDWLGAAFDGCSIYEATSGEQAIAVAAAYHPELVLMDIGLPGISGLEAAHVIHTADPAVRIIMLSIHDEARYRADAERIKAHAFVSKATLRTRLIPAILQAMSVHEESRL